MSWCHSVIVSWCHGVTMSRYHDFNDSPKTSRNFHKGGSSSAIFSLERAAGLSWRLKNPWLLGSVPMNGIVGNPSFTSMKPLLSSLPGAVSNYFSAWRSLINLFCGRETHDCAAVQNLSASSTKNACFGNWDAFSDKTDKKRATKWPKEFSQSACLDYVEKVAACRLSTSTRR